MACIRGGLVRRIGHLKAVDKISLMVRAEEVVALVRKVADHIFVMHKGQIIESGPSHQVISAPQHEHTRQLIDASPRLLAASNHFNPKTGAEQPR